MSGHPGHAQREPHAHGVPREHRRDGEGRPLDRGRRRRLRPLHAVRRVRAALPQHAVRGRLLPGAHGDREGGPRGTGAAGRQGARPRGLEAVEPAHRRAQERARARRRERAAERPGARARLGRGPRPADRRRDRDVRRLRGGLLPDLDPARDGAGAAEGRGRVRPDERAVVLWRPRGGDGLRRAVAPLRRAQPGRLAVHGDEADHRHRAARLHPLHRGLSGLLRRRLRHRGRADHGAARATHPRRAPPAREADQPDGHLPRPVPAQQAQGHLRGPARDPARDPGPDVQGRRPCDAVVVLLGRRRRAPDREARDHGRDQPPPAGARARSSTSTCW